MKYTILSFFSKEELMDEVNEHLALGWKLEGGVSVSAVEYEYENSREGGRETYRAELWAQAMVSTIAPE